MFPDTAFATMPHRDPSSAEARTALAGVPAVAPPLAPSARAARAAAQALMGQEPDPLEIALARGAALGLVFVCARRRVQACNPRFAATFGYDSVEAVRGVHVSRMYRSNVEFMALSNSAIPIMAAGGVFHAERQLCRKNGEVFWARLSGRLLDAHNPEGGAIWVVDDIDGQRSVRMRVGGGAASSGAAVERVSASVGLADSSPVRGVACFVQNRLTYCDAALERMLGYKPGTLLARAHSTSEAGDFLSNSPLGVLLDHGRRDENAAYSDSTVHLRHRSGRLVECRAVCRPIDAFEPQLGQVWVLLDLQSAAATTSGSADALLATARHASGIAHSVAQLPHLVQAPLWPRGDNPDLGRGQPVAAAAAAHIGHAVAPLVAAPLAPALAAPSALHPTHAAAAQAFAAQAQEQVYSQHFIHDHIHQLAYFDSLTGLPNRALLNDRSRQAIAVAQTTGSPIAVVFVNLDRFKHVNDSLGHRVGDTLLNQAAQHFQSIVREKDTVSRLSGDEFVLLLPGADSDGAERVARKLQEASRQPYLIEGHELNLTLSIGIAVFPQDGKDIEELLQAADMAMHEAKSTERGTFRFFNPQMRSKTQRALELESAMRRGIENDEFLLYYQPQVSIETGEIDCVEALVRWNKPGWGFISPGEFIPIAEASGQILQIGEWVLKTAVNQLRSWYSRGRTDLRVAVNISALQFHQTRLPEVVSEILQNAGVPAHLLELELTEGVAVHDPEVVSDIVDELNSRGILLAMDDFGTGYSSLSQLRRLQLHKLKIDQSFVRTLDTNSDDHAIVSAIIQMSRALNMTTTAEGVETEAQLEILRKLGCKKAQGYLFSRPLPADQLDVFLENHKPWGGKGSNVELF